MSAGGAAGGGKRGVRVKIGDRVRVHGLGRFHDGRTGRITHEYRGAPILGGRIADWMVLYDDIPPHRRDWCPYAEKDLFVIEER